MKNFFIFLGGVAAGIALLTRGALAINERDRLLAYEDGFDDGYDEGFDDGYGDEAVPEHTDEDGFAAGCEDPFCLFCYPDA